MTEVKYFKQPPIPTDIEDGVEEVVPPELEGLSPSVRNSAMEIKSNLEYVLDPHVPPDYKEHFRHYELLISRSLALANLPSWDFVFHYSQNVFGVVRLYLKLDHPELAVKTMAEMLMELQLSRSVGGMPAARLIASPSPYEQPQPQPQQLKKKKGGILGLFNR